MGSSPAVPATASGWARSTPQPRFAHRLRIRFPILPFQNKRRAFVLVVSPDAPVAQSAEHLPFKQGVRGSNPRWSTKPLKTQRFQGFLLFLYEKSDTLPEIAF